MRYLCGDNHLLKDIDQFLNGQEWTGLDVTVVTGGLINVVLIYHRVQKLVQQHTTAIIAQT